jgi:hypothetical protein
MAKVAVLPVPSETGDISYPNLDESNSFPNGRDYNYE